MKKILCFIITCSFILSMSGCKSGTEKINIIKGAGQANNSLLVNLKQLGNGEIEGFLKGDDILLCNSDANGKNFFKINSSTNEKLTLPTLPVAYGAQLQISPDGEQFVVDNSLVNIKANKWLSLPNLINEPSTSLNAKTVFMPLNSYSYMFTDESELLYTNPYYYVTKYLGTDIKSSAAKSPSKKEYNDLLALERHFKPFKLPDIALALSQPELLIDDLECIFIGFDNKTNKTCLYVFDLFSNKFKLIDENVRSYSISFDRKKIAYIKMAENESGQDKLLVSNMDGTAKKELATLPALVGLAWSKADSWIAFSGGEKSNYDIWVVKSNGTAKEQLTNGLFSTDKLFWSDNGNKVAFTSNKEFELADLTGIKPSSEAISDFSLPVDNSTAYILTLNIQDSKKSSITHQASSSRTELSQHILNILRRETELNLK